MPERRDAAAATDRFDRRDAWRLPPRPEWLARFNALGRRADIRSVVVWCRSFDVDFAIATLEPET